MNEDGGASEEPPGFEPADPWQEFFEPTDYPQHRARKLLTRGVALVLVVGLLLAFPLGYVLNEQLRNQHVEAVAAIVEIVLVAVVVAVLRSNRRPL